MAPWVSMWLFVCFLGAAQVNGKSYKLEMPTGETAQVSSLDEFLEAISLTEYASVLEEGGMTIDDAAAATAEDLAELGIKKLMHRKRFLRTAGTLKAASAQVITAAKKKPTPEPEDDDSMVVDEDESEYDSSFVDTNEERNLIKPMPSKKNRKKFKYNSDEDRELAEAVEDGNIYDMEAAISKGANINMWIEEDGEFKTPLMHATLNGNLDPPERLAMVKALLKHNPDKSKGTKNSEFSALHGASYAGFADITRVLLAAGFDPNERHKDGFIPMHRACWGNQPNHTETVLAHLEFGVDVNTTAEDPKEEDPAKKIMTPLEMVEKNWANPMTMGLLESWIETGKKPDGAMDTWGSNHQNDHHGTVEDVQKKRDEVESLDIDADDSFEDDEQDQDKEL